jgi:RNA polymerase sigma-70 factor (ECF subfamily)
MYGICLRFAGNKMDADDILQEAFIKIFKNINEFKSKGSFEGWIRRIIVNTAINFHKRKVRISRTEETDLKEVSHSVNANAFSLLSQSELIDMIQELPNGYRTVFNLNVVEGYTHKEIAEMLDISDNTSKSQLVRARRILQKKIQSQIAEKYSAPVDCLRIIKNGNVKHSNELTEYLEAV